MKVANCYLRGVSPYSQSKHHMTDRLNKESDQDYEARTWRERMHYDDAGNVLIPPMAFANCIKVAAKYDSRKIPGKGNSTYTKNFVSGIMVVDPLVLSSKKDEVRGEWLFVPSQGQRGGSKRVMKCFPLIPEWVGWVRFYIIDDTVTKNIFKETLELAGLVIGIGRFRPERHGFYGRFKVEKIEWSDVSVEEVSNV